VTALKETALFKDWIGRARSEDDEVSLPAVRRLAATLDQDPDAYHPGSEVPESWYVILFGPTAPQSMLARDGHVTTGDFLPPLHGARRMFGGRRVRFHQALRAGDRVQRLSRIARADAKSGRSGPFTLITIVHELSVRGELGGGLAVTEEQDIVYRTPAAPEVRERDDATAGAVAPRKAVPTDARADAPSIAESIKPDWSRTIVPDPVLLFRYSALTFNAHRIHYDAPYTLEAEGYPALVVNGGLTALLLVETARKHLLGRISGYEARALRPLFVGQRIILSGRRSGEAAELWASGPDGSRAYQVNASLERLS
jgi:3-methylfumaryl-CoA hydratase